MQNSPIGIFDSGVGGLTILSEIQKLLPKESFVYLADQKNAPYGDKSKLVIQKRARAISHFLIKHKVKLIVVACNTSTIASISILRKNFHIPIIGVVPVVKKASEETKTKKIAIFATPSTIKSSYLKNLIETYAHNVTVFKNGATGLEKLVEAGNIHNKKIAEILKTNLLPLKKKGVDVIALGCTHYPFLKTDIQKIIGQDVLILDSGGAVARQTKRILEANHMLADKKDKDWYYTTGNADVFCKIVKKLTNKKLTVESIQV